MASVPKPLVKTPAKITHGGVVKWKYGRGFSIGELRALGLSVDQARLLGIPVDERRETSWPQNIEALRKWLIDLLEGRAQAPDPTYPKLVKVKRKRGRAFRGLTSAGRKSRGLVSTKFRETHNYKYKKKAKERRLKKRHEATKGLGNLLRISRIINDGSK
ncbi:ribosomal protein L13 [Pyrobaculum aerophilum str. IM2]|uniref:Large ribosomal subunit protein eL13 n=2 Tax=Pyrobaculum aerophilum TaxID=13773 RepID=Q8ZWS7_PYRAE|nr:MULTISPECIES: ribosomal protein L13e [Pyrobaculum]AAL63622.1 ribosomal protein L13 [Pyrobaculum aerophilum str. IM2]HII46256.1 ribosomal protein L13e [Pyrobaculum aerophilum]